MARRPPRIRNVQVATHSRCNANCVFCPYVESWHARTPGVMSDEVWTRILAELAQPEIRVGLEDGKFCPYLMQEPLLDPRIYERIDQVFETFPGITVEISTNGAALTPGNADRLLSVLHQSDRRSDVWISFHGTSDAMVRELMQIDPSHVDRNIKYFIGKAERLLDPKRCQIVLRGAGYDFSRKRQYYSREDYETFWRSRLPQPASALVAIDHFGFHDRAGTIARAERNAGSLNYGIVRIIDDAHPFHCSRLDEWLHFMYDGSIVLCCMDYHREVSLPNIMQVSLIEYFDSPAYRSLVDQVTGKAASPERFICKRCSQPTPPGAGRWRPQESA